MSMRRLAGLCSALVFCLGIVLCRVYWVGGDTAYAASAGAQTVSGTALPQRRGDFTDRKGRLLTGYTRRWYALCIPGDSSYATLFPYVSYGAQTALYEKRNALTPFLVEVERDLTKQGVYTYAGAQRYLPLPIAAHLIGYLDGEGNGVTGLERAYDDVLAASGSDLLVECTTTSRGSLVAGAAPEIVTQEKGTGQGVQLTLDADIQRACEAIAMQTMDRGCILVLEADSGNVLASVSMPAYDPNHVAKSIAANDTSLINRTFSGFSAGSVFKVVLAAAAYANGLDWFTYECEGSIEVADQVYRCAKGRAHGEVNLRGALEQSCNCYFVALGQLLGAETVLQAAENFGFGTACAVAPGLKSSAGTLPALESLQNPGQLAVFSFGQGALTATPLQIAAMTNAIANGGTLLTPRFVEGLTGEDGALEEPYTAAEPRPACSEDTARVLRSMLRTVVTEGIGADAAPEEGEAGGKTGTAQTGQFNEAGEELLNYWFTGFYPADAPRYTITVLQDGVLEPETGSAAVFAQVANALHAMENS